MNDTAVLERASNPKWRQDYRPGPDAFDEMLAPDQSVRPHWQAFVSEFDKLGPEELAERWQQAQRLIHENGVTYNVCGDSEGKDRPWELDSVPFLIPAQTWNTLESALTQRARLLNALLDDLYGAQVLMRSGLLPPELVYQHPMFLRACCGIRPPLRSHLFFYAADIVRLPDGSWSVIADRTQAPSGAGYALENRIVLSRVFPEVFKACQSQRLALFFRTLRETLSALAPFNRDNPRVVFLTPGPYHETYFEHAYLARYLGYTLVEAGDLTVRDQCVYLKTLGGLHRVDVIFRHVHGELCDTLELRPDSPNGIPGLVEAVRAGKVAVANPLGSGAAQSPALNPFLPALCRHLLGEDLRMPSINTFWCGNQTSLQHVICNLDRMVIKPSFPTNVEPIFGARLSREQRQALASRIRAHPYRFVAQEQMTFSTAPVLNDFRIEARHVVLRTFLVATRNGGYSVMPGGLTQVSGAPDALVFSLRHGGGSKDTWVEAGGPVSTFTLLHPSNQPIELSRGGSDLPSRVADDLFWLGRYVERAETAVRLMRVIVARLSIKSGLYEIPELPWLIRALKCQRQRSLETEPTGAQAVSSGDELRTIMQGSRSPGGLLATLQLLQGNARMLRDRLSNDTWRIIRSLSPELAWPAHLDDAHINQVLQQLDVLVTTLASFGGLASESMTRGQAWRFLDMGRRLERAVDLAGLFQNTLIEVSRYESQVLESLLEVCDSSMTYRRRYMASLQLGPVLDLLLADESNPRSLAFQIMALDDHVENLPRDHSSPQLTPEQRITVAHLSRLRLIDIEALCRANPSGYREHFAATLSRLDSDMAALSDVISRRYLSHAQTSRQLATLRPEAGA